MLIDAGVFSIKIKNNMIITVFLYVICQNFLAREKKEMINISTTIQSRMSYVHDCFFIADFHHDVKAML